MPTQLIFLEFKDTNLIVKPILELLLLSYVIVTHVNVKFISTCLKKMFLH